jgi:hypothetical protein
LRGEAKTLRLRPEQAAAEAARHAAGSESLTELVAEARRKVAEARAARAAAAAVAEQQRKEQQRQRKVEEAREALQRAIALMEETAGVRGVDAVEEAMRAAAKHVARSESLTALVAQARVLIEQARAAEAERTRVAAEEAAAAEAAAEVTAAAERLRLEEEAAALATRLQEVQAQLGVPPAAPNPGAEETQCVVCMDAPKDRIVLPCMHLCACGPCAQRLLELDASCPVCRGPVERMAQVFS